MTYIYNKVERMIKWGMMLCLLALLPMSVLADEYGISEEYDTWFTSDDVNYGSIYAAVYGCNVEGEISGKAQNSTDLYYKTRVGGLIGQIQAPASVYRCHADVKITTRRINWIGGIAGYIENDINWEKGSINSELFPSWSYLFDCTANVNITARTDAEGKEASVGGICGMNDGGNIMACGAVGNIELDVAEDVDDPEIDGHQVGGIAGTNNRNIIDCASGVSLFGIHEVGGIVGLSEKNNDLTSSFGIIINCVYSGHIDATHALSAHGIVGNTVKHNTSSAIVNSLFLGTITYEEGKSGKAVAPLWEEESEASGNNNQNVEENNYSDMNLYDEGSNLDNVYRTFLEFTSGKTSLVPFRGTFSFDKLYGKEDINVGGAWQLQEGFYPRLQIGAANITNVSGSDRTTNDRIIIRAATAMGDDAADLKTPKLFPAYAWLASVPAGFNNDGGSAQFLDAPLSLAAKRQVMDANTQNVAHYSLPANQTLLTVTGETDAQTATPKVNAVGNVLLTITSSDNISKQLRLDVNGSRTWDGKTGRVFDDGNGTEGSPYLIHNARQLIKAFSSNDAGEYYKLKNDIWFNENLLTADGNISNTGVAWSDTEKSWKAHLDGDGHAIRGLYASSANSMLGSIAENASLENVAFTDCAVKTQDNASGVGGFLGTSFQDKDRLQTLEFSNKITELSDNDFRGNTSMTAFTIPTSVKSVSGQAFAGSGLTNFEVETDHSTFAAVDGLLLSGSKDMLVSYPSGRTDASIDLSSNIKSIGQNAIYKLPQLNAVYIDAADYDYETVVELGTNGIVHAQNGSKMQIYIEDATNDDYSPDADAREYTMRAPRRAGETGEGNPHLLNKYKAAAQWQTSDMEISNYWDLVVSANSKDGDNKYWATMFIGFDTELPEGLTPYIVDKEKTKESETTLVLREINRKVPMMTPVVIMADEAKTYRLYPSKEARWAELPMSENLLDGVDRNGMDVNQAAANDGGCLTLGKNKSGEIGFFIYKGTNKIPAFRAYISVNKVGYASALTFSYADDETTGVNSIDNGQLTIDNSGVYNLAGQRVGQPSKGIYIKNGRKYVIK